MIVLGLDPGTRRVGYGLVSGGSRPELLRAGILAVGKGTEIEALGEVGRGVKKLIREFHPKLVAVEKLFFAKNRKTALAVAQARGVILAACAESGVDIKEFAPNEVKAGLTGYGGADKAAILKMVRLILGKPGLELIDDASDALALALIASRSIRRLKPAGD